MFYDVPRLVFLCRIHPNNMEYTSYGKPNPFVFKNVENVLTQVLQSAYNNIQVTGETQPLKTLYMIGDNPSVDIEGARQVWVLGCINCIKLFLRECIKFLIFPGWASLVFNFDKDGCFQRKGKSRGLSSRYGRWIDSGKFFAYLYFVVTQKLKNSICPHLFHPAILRKKD